MASVIPHQLCSFTTVGTLLMNSMWYIDRARPTKMHALSKKSITLVALNPSMETADLAEAQQQDLVLSRMFQQMQSATPPQRLGIRETTSKALQAALVPTVSAQCCHMPQGAFIHDQEARLLVVVPKSRQKAFLDCS